MARLEIALMGSPEVRLDGNPVEGFRSVRARALLYYLAVSRQMHLRPVLADLLWSEWSESSARINLNQTLYNVRQLVGDHLIVTRQAAGLDRQSDYWLDVEVIRSDDVELDQVLSLLRGEFLAGFHVQDAPVFETWLLRERERQRERPLETLDRLAQMHSARQEWPQAIEATRRVLALEPWQEEKHRQLMRLLAESGQRSAALAQYDTCRRVLSERLGAEPTEETDALMMRIRSGDFPGQATIRSQNGPDVPASPEAEVAPVGVAPAYTLPVQTTPFVGRAEELAAILARLQDPSCRLLTLVGPGGIGKTRLALQAAHCLLDAKDGVPPTGDGVFFVPLAAVDAGSGTISAIADAIGFRFYGSLAPRRQLLGYLQEKRMVLVLDNFEHLLLDADLLAEVLAIAPYVKLLVTSRVALNLQEEWFFSVTGMAFPSQTSTGLHPDGVLAVSQYDAVRLFVQSAQRARVDFSLAGGEKPVVEICRLVEGMPLGIELAAAWLKVLPVQQVAAELSRNLDILTARHQNVPPRHRSMRVVREQSWQLLSAQEQNVLMRLAVFRGGFTLDAAAEVTGTSLLTLARLVEKAWLRVDASGRYQIHELLRQFAAEQLGVVPEIMQETYGRHSAYYLQFAGAQKDTLVGANLKEALAAIGGEIDNIRHAWTWAVEQRGDGLGAAAEALYYFYQMQGRFLEGQETFARPIERLGTDGQPSMGDALVSALLYRGAFLLHLGSYNAARADLVAGLSAATSDRQRAFALNFLGRVAHLQGRRADAEDSLAQSIGLSRQAGNLYGIAEALTSLSALYSSYGEFPKAHALAAESLSVSRQVGHPYLVTAALGAIAWPTNCLGDYKQSADYWQESLDICRQIGNLGHMATAINYLGWAAWCAGGPAVATAIDYLCQALAIYSRIGDRTNVASCLGDLTVVNAELGNHQIALDYGLEGLATAREIGHFDLVPYNLYALGAAACGAGDFKSSRQYLVESMKIAWQRKVPYHAVIALYFYSALLAKESGLLEEGGIERFGEVASILVTLRTVIDFPPTWQPIRDRAAQLYNTLLSQQPDDVRAAVDARIEVRPWEHVLAEILSAAGESLPVQ